MDLVMLGLVILGIVGLCSTMVRHFWRRGCCAGGMDDATAIGVGDK
jgi:hypothetical protein